MTDDRRILCDGYVWREMRDADRARLAEIDRQADQLFLETGITNIMAIATGPLTPLPAFNTMLDACSVAVACSADDRPVGFAAVQRLQDDIYLRLLAVDPEHGRRGIGASLLALTIEIGRQQGAERCVLSTFRDVSFNQPFYQRHGFSELPRGEATLPVQQQFKADIPEGIDAAQRLLMARDL